MKQQIQQQFEALLEQASEQDLTYLQHIFTGLEQKHKGIYRRYINAALHMTGEFFADYSIVTIPITQIIHNTIQVPHGGVLATIADAAMGGLASRSTEPGKNVVTTNLSMNYIATTTKKQLIARATFVHKGRRTMVLQCEITDETGRLLATANGSFFVIERRV